MKKICLFLFLCFLNYCLFSQQNGSYYNNIIELMDQKKYYQAIIQLEDYLLKNPKDAGMYFNKGLAEYEMNDYYASKKDFLQSMKLGYHENDDFINWVCSNDYKVKILSEHYIENNSLTAANNFKPVFNLKDSLQGALRPERTCFDVYFYNLTVKILPKTKSIEGVNHIYFKTTANTKKIQIDLSEKFKINSINYNGRELKYTRKYNAVFIEFDETIPVNSKQIITIKYSGIPRVAPSPPWNGGFVWSTNRNKWWVGVACEHLGASSWWPCKDHLTDKPDSMCVNIQVPDGYQAISNGNLRSTKTIENKYTNYEWFVSYPINTYCVTFYMGKFINFNETFTNASGTYQIDYYVQKNNLLKAKEYYKQTKDIVKVFEKLFGEYPYKKDGIAMVEAPFVGMEHQSAIAIGSEYGSKKRRNYENLDYDYLVVHETAHEWWGNTVTMGDMADAWISEGFATYAEHLFIEEKYGYKEYISAVAENMLNIVNIWPMVGLRDVNDNTFIGGDIYHKGAAMLNNLRCTINDDSLFFSIIKGFYNNYKFKIATSTDFVNYVNSSTGQDYNSFFNKFLYDPEPPVLEYEYTLKNDTLLFYYKWINVEPSFTMPFSITLNGISNIRFVGTTEKQGIKTANIKSFYLPNEKHFNKNLISNNSFTYYWTSWKH